MSKDEHELDLLVGDLTTQLATVKRALVMVLAARDNEGLVAVNLEGVHAQDNARRVVREL